MAPESIAVSAVVSSKKQAQSEKRAAAALVRSLIEHAEETVRKDTLREFYAANHSKAIVFAFAALKNRCEAEEAVSKTYVELLGGRTRPEFFFRALKSNVLDRQRRLRREQAVFEPAERSFDPGDEASEYRMPGVERDEFSLGLPSSRPEDQDPLEILLQREELKAHVKKVMSDRKYRGVRDRQWWKALVRLAVPESAGWRE